MEIRITTGTYNTPDFRVVKEFKRIKSAQKYISSIGCKADIYNGLEFSQAGITYKITVN